MEINNHRIITRRETKYNLKKSSIIISNGLSNGTLYEYDCSWEKKFSKIADKQGNQESYKHVYSTNNTV